MKLLSRNPDKPKKQLETTIGKIIYGFLLFAPLLSILVTCMYVTFNKNAYESYSGNETITDYEINYKYETNEVNTINDLVVGNIYKYYLKNNTNIPSESSVDKIKATSIYLLDSTLKKVTYNIDNYNTNYISIRYNARNTIYYAIANGGSGDSLGTIDEISDYCYVVYDSSTTYTNIEDLSISDFNIIESVTEETTQATNLDNAFEYGTYKVENSNLYNWAKETGTYDILHNTTQLLGIENTFIPMLMAYWLLISVIYFIYDIALMLIMVVHRKIHELQESI